MLRRHHRHGTRLAVDLVADDAPVELAALPETLVQFARSARFADEAARLATADGSPLLEVCQRLLAATAGMATVGNGPFLDSEQE